MPTNPHRDALDRSGLTELIGELVRSVGVTEAARTLAGIITDVYMADETVEPQVRAEHGAEVR